ncbi:glycerol-3-phosphate acyltransferase 4-like [Brevipalpus obovatus]|uniref:glycerol-3-phosphate acyltransferase 4-like n=1 Tax=Brevipalpus obovatus TaxID=246614 RepID=UPI003D9DF290
MTAHLEDTRKFPIIVYPEGTCTTDNVIMRFRKGWFDIVSEVYPSAIEYDIRYGPVFWNSRTKSIWLYFWKIFQNWATVCDIYYMAPMQKEKDESGAMFANRVQNAIADKINLKRIDFDGYSIKYGHRKTR